MSNNIKVIQAQDYTDVIATATRYVEGVRTGTAEDVATAFNDEAMMYGFINGERFDGPISNLYDFIKVNGGAPALSTHLDVIAITPTTAVVRVELEKDALGADFTDFLTLLKEDGAWRILVKVYHQYNV
jgi:hypothetical protein